MALERGQQPFTRREYEARWAALKATMSERGVQTILSTDGKSMTYLSGYIGSSGYLPQMVILDLNWNEPKLVLRKQDVPLGIYTTQLSRDGIIGYPETLVGNPEKDGHDFALDLLEDLGPRGGLVGLEESELSRAAHRKYENRLCAASIADFSGVIVRQRLIKSEAEVALMRDAARIADAGVLAAVSATRPGRRECEIGGDVVHALASGLTDIDTITVSVPNISSGPRIGTAHYNWYLGTVEQGMQVNFEMVGLRHHYSASIMRTISLGQPSDKLRRLHDGVLDGLEAGLATVRPGVTCADVANAYQRALNRHGFSKDSRCGYSIGMGLEPSASLQPSDMTVLKPNMTFHMMLGTWVEEDFGVTLSESFRVTDTGIEVFGKSERKLFVV
ncbi:Xaa-Pro peptidase family protein [Mesorhizobium australicum]|uniref:Xaa-Pro peptidase family protein n=1 Tax=Mesorhizobium australicum TaxID=536018 RepID=UPI00333A6BD4